MPNELFAKRFTKALKLSGLQQRELAERLGVHPSNITRYKTGSYVPSDLDDIAKIAKILGVSPAWLSGMTSDERIVEPSRKDIAHNKIENYIADMTDEQTESVLKFIETFVIPK